MGDVGGRVAAFASSKSDVDVEGAGGAGRSCWISDDGSGLSAEGVAAPAAAAAGVLNLAATDATAGMCEAGMCSCGLETESSGDEHSLTLEEKGVDMVAYPKRILEM